MNELALFAGAGGGLLATKHLLGWRTVCYVEINEYRVEVLKARIGDGLLDDAPIWDDARTFDGRPWRGCVDIVTAGFPCQPFSGAGNQEADGDDRNLWPDTIRVIREVKPGFIFLENVAGLLSVFGSDDRRYFGRVLGDLAESGYNARWDCLPAAAIGAAHIRDRVWVLGWCSNGDGILAYSNERGFSYEGDERCGEGKVQFWPQSLRSRANIPRFPWWQVEPGMGRLAHGVANRVERGYAIADGQVPAVVATVWRLLTQDA